MSATTKKFYLTIQGRARFENELLALENYARSVAAKLKRAVSRDSKAENGDLEIASAEMDFAEGRINELAYILENSQTIHRPHSHSQVKLGSEISVTCVGAGCDKAKQVYQLVGSLEASPAAGKLSVESPLGKALMGKRVGETIAIRSPQGEANYRILKIG